MTAAPEIEIVVQNQSGFAADLAVPVDSQVGDIIKAIQQEAPDQLPEVDRQGRLVRYALENTRTGTYLDPNAAVQDVDLKEGDVLEVHMKPIAM